MSKEKVSESLSATISSKGEKTGKNKSFKKNSFISKNDLLSWINNLLKVNLTLVEQLGSGTVYCQILDVIYPGQIPLQKVKWNARLEYDFLHNLKILQQSFDKHQVPKVIPINKLAKVKYQDNLEFAQWFKAYFDFSCKDKGKDYDAVSRRGNSVPYFGFCKGGVLPKQTLFFRNPNEKISMEQSSNMNVKTHSENNELSGDSTEFGTPNPPTSPGENEKGLTQSQIDIQKRGDNLIKQSLIKDQLKLEAVKLTSTAPQKDINNYFSREDNDILQNGKSSNLTDDKEQSQGQEQLTPHTFDHDSSQKRTNITLNRFFSRQQTTGEEVQQKYSLGQLPKQINFFGRDLIESMSGLTNKRDIKEKPMMNTSVFLGKIKELNQVSKILLRKNTDVTIINEEKQDEQHLISCPFFLAPDSLPKKEISEDLITNYKSIEQIIVSSKNQTNFFKREDYTANPEDEYLNTEKFRNNFFQGNQFKESNAVDSEQKTDRSSLSCNYNGDKGKGNINISPVKEVLIKKIKKNDPDNSNILSQETLLNKTRVEKIQSIISCLQGDYNQIIQQVKAICNSQQE